MSKKKEIYEAAQEMGRKGGKATLKKLGREHFIKMGKLRWPKKDK